MKKILLSILAVGVFASSFGQQAGGGPGLEFGLRGEAVSAWLFNSNVSNAGGSQNYSPAFSYGYGLHVAYNFSDKIALEVNLMLGTITQGYSGTFSSGGEFVNEPVDYFYANNETYKATTQLNIMGIPVLFRLGSGNGAYVEIGAEYDIINSATYNATYTSEPTILGSPASYNFTSTPSFAKSNIQGVLGFGNDFQIGSSGLNIITNLRFSYGFTDMQGTDAMGQDLNQTEANGSSNVLYKQFGTTPAYYASYKPTHTVTASFTLGAYYYIPITTSKGGRTACKHPPRVRS